MLDPETKELVDIVRKALIAYAETGPTGELDTAIWLHGKQTKRANTQLSAELRQLDLLGKLPEGYGTDLTAIKRAKERVLTCLEEAVRRYNAEDLA